VIVSKDSQAYKQKVSQFATACMADLCDCARVSSVQRGEKVSQVDVGLIGAYPTYIPPTLSKIRA
jgi:hypothetical protein